MSRMLALKKLSTAISQTSRIVKVNVSELHIDPAMQRRLNRHWVEAHVALFDPEKLGRIVVSRRADGKLYIVDGQHRVELLRAIGYGDQDIEAELFEGLTRQGEADLFLARNDRIAVKTFDKFRLRIEAGDPAAVGVANVLKGLGLSLSSSREVGTVTAVAALEFVYTGARITSDVLGPAVLKTTLEIILKAWGRDAKNFEGAIISGLGIVVLRFGTVIDLGTLIDKLSKTPGPNWLQGRAKAMAAVVRGKAANAMARVIVDEVYNVGRRAGKLAW
jgi:hypothetical protein